MWEMGNFFVLSRREKSQPRKGTGIGYRRSIVSLIVLSFLCTVAIADTPAPDAPPKANWKAVADVIGTSGELKDEVYTITIPREDLSVSIDGMPIPAAAGLAHRFHFFLCSCGKTIVVGEFCVPDYEANDVMDALRAGALLRVGSASNLFIGDNSKMMCVRFQGEGDPLVMAKLVKQALNWTGEARNKKNEIK